MNKFLNLVIACDISEMKLKIKQLEKALDKACDMLAKLDVSYLELYKKNQTPTHIIRREYWKEWCMKDD